MKVMRFFVSLGIIMIWGCSTTNYISSCKEDVEIVSVSYQERVSGVADYGSTYYFNFKFEISDNAVVPDSVFFKNNAGKIVQNSDLQTFYAKVHVKPEENKAGDNSVRISFKKEEKITILSPDSVTVLEKQHMP